MRAMNAMASHFFSGIEGDWCRIIERIRARYGPTISDRFKTQFPDADAKLPSVNEMREQLANIVKEENEKSLEEAKKASKRVAASPGMPLEKVISLSEARRNAA